MTVERLLPDDDAVALLDLACHLAEGELAPLAAAYERDKRFPREVFTRLGRAGLLSLPYSADHGGGGVATPVYLQVIEELASTWLAVAMGVSVHTLACFPLAEYGTDEQRDRWLPGLLGGEQLGAYCLSEPESGSDAAALSNRAVLDGDDYVVTGTKAWITHGGVADFYDVMVRTSDDGARGITCLLVDAATFGLTAGQPEAKMGVNSSTTTALHLESARVPVDRRIGAEGQGFEIAMAALDAGRLGIAACAVGLGQAALDAAAAYARERHAFGRPIADFQGLSFMLADMATELAASRALYLDAARLKDAGRPFTTAAAMAKLHATDATMRITTDAVQVLGGYGYTQDYPLERYMREAKLLQIVEGTNQIQRLVIGRDLTRARRSQDRYTGGHGRVTTS